VYLQHVERAGLAFRVAQLCQAVRRSRLLQRRAQARSAPLQAVEGAQSAPDLTESLHDLAGMLLDGGAQVGTPFQQPGR
jgi:hypothetical protein